MVKESNLNSAVKVGSKTPYVWDKKRNRKVSRYQQGYKYCSECVLWNKTDKIMCPNCNNKLRWTPRDYRSKWYVKQRDIKRV